MKEALHEGRIQLLHAELLAGLAPHLQRDLLSRILTEDLGVNQLRRVIREMRVAAGAGPHAEIALRMPRGVELAADGKGKCTVRITIGAPECGAELVAAIEMALERVRRRLEPRARGGNRFPGEGARGEVQE